MARVRWLLGLVLGVWLTGARAHAEPPSCVELALPQQLPQRAAWNTLLMQETRPLLAGEGGPCAQIEVQESDTGPALTLEVSWAGASRVLPLVLEDLPEGQRPRAAALLAHGLLQQLVDEPPAEDAPGQPLAPAAANEPGLPAWDQATDGPGSASQLTPPRPTPRRPKRTPWDDYEWQRGAGTNDRFEGPAHRHGSRWSGAAYSGGGLALTSLTGLLQLELAAQHQFDLAHMRLGIGLIAMFASSRMFVGGPGARGSLDFRVTQSKYARLWLGPGLSFTVLVMQASSEGVYDTNMVRGVAAADVRASVDMAVSRRVYLTLALELAYPLRYLRVVSGDTTLFAYAGPLLGLRVGVGF